MGFTDYIIWPFAWLLRFFHGISGSYLFALLIFTVVLRLVMLPSSIKNQKTQATNIFINAKQKKIMERYKDDKEKQMQARQELYQNENQSMTSGCLVSLLPLLILLPVYKIIYQPLTYIGQFTTAQIDKLKAVLEVSDKARNVEFEIIEKINTAAASGIDADVVEKIKGLNIPEYLVQTPSITNITWIVIIPILAAFTTYLSFKLSMKMSGQSDAQMGGCGMTLMMPIMTLFMCFSLPSGVGIYWLMSNIVGMVIQYFLHKFYNPKMINAKIETKRRLARIENEKKIKEQAM